MFLESKSTHLESLHIIQVNAEEVMKQRKERKEGSLLWGQLAFEGRFSQVADITVYRICNSCVLSPLTFSWLSCSLPLTLNMRKCSQSLNKDNIQNSRFIAL